MKRVASHQHEGDEEGLRYSRVVVKLGTGVLNDNRKQLDPAQMEQFVAQIAAQRKVGKELGLWS